MENHSILLVLFAATWLVFVNSQYIGQVEKVYGMKWANFTFRTPQEYQDYVDNKVYKNVFVPGAKVSLSGRHFASTPRLWKTVPSTFNEVFMAPEENTVKLRPYPSWDWQVVGNQTALQSVFGFEIDGKNRLWLLDAGYITEKPFGNVTSHGPAKLVVFDLTTDEHLFSYVFPSDFAPYPGPNLNDIVVDIHKGFAYISDLSGAVIVFNENAMESRRVLANTPYTDPDPNVWITIHAFGNYEKVFRDKPLMAGTDGIALTPDGKTLYFNPLTSRALYSISTSLLQDFSTPESTLLNSVKTIFKSRISSNDGMTFASNGMLYYTACELSALVQVNVTDPDNPVERLLAASPDFKWPDTFAFDNNGWMVFSTSDINRVIQGNADWDTEVYKLWRVFIDANSYM